MKILELLQERLTADVHINDEQKLFVITDLVQKSFGPQFTKITQSCLAGQMVYSMSAVSKIPYSELITAINRSPITGGYDGVKLESLYSLFDNKPFKLSNGKTVTFDLSLETPDIDQAIKDVKLGQPVMMVVGVDIMQKIDDDLNNDDLPDQTGIVSKFKKSEVKTFKKLVGNNTFHTYLLIGYDSEHDHAIFRETRSVYGFKGYMKIPYETLKRLKGRYKLLTIVVDDCKIEDNQK